MYGLLLKNLQAYIIQSYGAKKWKEIKGVLKIDQVSPVPGYWRSSSLKLPETELLETF